jgi:hypothetical protein
MTAAPIEGVGLLFPANRLKRQRDVRCRTVSRLRRCARTRKASGTDQHGVKAKEKSPIVFVIAWVEDRNKEGREKAAGLPIVPRIATAHKSCTRRSSVIGSQMISQQYTKRISCKGSAS